NARYQHCKLVKETAEKLNIVLEFLPGYSPNLNLIERLWKYMKKILGKERPDGKKSFFKAVLSLLETLDNEEYQNKLWTLLNPIFQRFEKSQILGC
ncbi:MAG: transposase, partial [Maribacter sp.]